MILRRLGNKKNLMPLLIPHFPDHKLWIEPFFGSGSAFFYKPKAKYNIVNDLDSDVFNLFQVVMNQKEELEKAFHIMPIHSDLFEFWRRNKENDPIKKALRFLFLSNFTLYGKGSSLKYTSQNTKENFSNRLKGTYSLISDVLFNNKDAVKFLLSISFQNKEKAFIYLDPPYIETENNYCEGYTEGQLIELFDCLDNLGVKFAMSEFDNSFIINQAKQRGLRINIIGERQNIKNRRTEILLTNYRTNQQEFNFEL